MPFWLCAIADGLGGHQDGAIASSMATEVLANKINNAAKTMMKTGDLGAVKEESILEILSDSAKKANKEIFAHRKNDMGTTLVAAILLADVVYIANVGDSRAYLFNGVVLRRITADHSLVAELVRSGDIMEDDLYTHPLRNIVTRSLGAQEDVQVDTYREVVTPGDYLILCSDGLWEMVKDTEIRDTIAGKAPPQDSCEKLVQVAKNHGGVDNISVIVAKAII